MQVMDKPRITDGQGKEVVGKPAAIALLNERIQRGDTRTSERPRTTLVELQQFDYLVRKNPDLVAHWTGRGRVYYVEKLREIPLEEPPGSGTGADWSKEIKNHAGQLWLNGLTPQEVATEISNQTGRPLARQVVRKWIEPIMTEENKAIHKQHLEENPNTPHRTGRKEQL